MDWISSLLLATVRLAIPLLLISLAELYGQRAGMVNIGLEGLAAIGALVGFLMCYITGSNWIGLLCGALAGLLVNMIYAFSTVTLCADHTVYGMAINIFAPALASFIYRIVFGTGSDLKQIITMPSIAIPGLKDIPVIGPLLFDQSPMVYLTLLLVVFTSIFFNRTRAGLSYKSVGEHPQAAATLGINVIGVKYLACMICGALAGLGGAAAVLGTILAMIVVPMITRAGWAPFFIFGGLLFPVSLLAVFLFGGRIQNIDEEKQQ